MRDQVWYIALLIGSMCFVRFGLAAYGYIDPVALMESLGAPSDLNVQAPYIVRVWAIRDIVIALMVALARPTYIKQVLIACIAIDLTDIFTAHISGVSGLFSSAETWSLKITAIAALVPESLALALIFRRNSRSNFGQ
jgi:hypothetical protein